MESDTLKIEDQVPTPLENLTLEQIETTLRIMVAQKGELLAKVQLLELQCTILQQQFNRLNPPPEEPTDKKE